MKAQNIFKVMAPVDFKALSSDVLQLKSSPANKFVHSNVVYCQNRRIYGAFPGITNQVVLFKFKNHLSSYYEFSR